MRDGQLGVIPAGGLWLIVPFAIVMPDIMAWQLYGEQLGAQADKAYPTLIRELMPAGLRGFILAAIAGAVISTLGSLLNSASAIFTMDIYRRLLRPAAEGVFALVAGPLIYGLFQFTGKSVARPGGHSLHFLIQVFLSFVLVAAIMGVITRLRPLAKPRRLPGRKAMAVSTDPMVKVAGAAVLLGVLFLFVVFR